MSLKLQLIRSEVRNDAMGYGTMGVVCEFRGVTDDYTEWTEINDKLLKEGITVNAHGLVDEALALLRDELKAEQQKHVDFCRKVEHAAAVARQELSYLAKALEDKESELTRLRAMEAELARLAVLTTT